MARKRKKGDDEESPKKKKRKRPRDEDEREDEDEEEDDRGREDEEDEVDGPPVKTGPRDDAYTGLLAVTLVALIAAAVLFYLDSSSLSAQPVQAPNMPMPGLGENPKAAPGR